MLSVGDLGVGCLGFGVVEGLGLSGFHARVPSAASRGFSQITRGLCGV